MKRILFLASLLAGLALAFAPIDAPRVVAQTFPGQTSPGYIPIGQGAAQIKWLPISGCTLTSPGALSCPAGSIAVGSTPITSPTANQLLYDNAGTLGEVTKCNSGVYVTNGSGVPSCGAAVLASNLPAGVPANALNTQTSNYSIATTDCGKTVQAGTGSTGFFQLTVPAVAGFATNCVVALTNGDTGRGKGLVSDPGCSSRSMLWPGQTCIIGIVNGAWAVLSRPGRWRSPGGVLNFYTNFTTGSDTNGADDGLDPSTPFKTAQECFINAADQIDLNTNNQTQIVCNMAAATTDTQGMHAPVHALMGGQGGAAFQVVGASLAITGAVSNGGLCEITVSSTSTYSANEVVSVYGVGGATGCNGTWKVTVTDITHLTLQSTTFGGSYTSGGTVTNGSVMSVTGNAAAACYFGTVVQFSNIFFQSNSNTFGPDWGCKVYVLSGNIFGGSPASHFFITDQGQVHINGDIGIASGATNALAQVQKQGMLVSDNAINVNFLPGLGTISFSGLATLYVDTMSMINASTWTFNLNGNTVTGTRCSANQNGLIVSNGTPNTQFPGNVNCTNGTGGTVN